MTITIAMTVMTVFTLCILLLNMDELLAQKYSPHRKKQRTILCISKTHAFDLRTCVSHQMIVDWFKLALLLRLPPSLCRSIWSAIRSPIAVVA